MKRIVIGAGCFAAGIIVGVNLQKCNRTSIKDILSKESSLIEKFKKNPINKKFMKLIKKGGK